MLDPVCRVFDASGQLAHLCLEPIHAQLSVDRAGTCGDDRAWSAAVDLPLQHAEVLLQAVQAVLHRPVLRVRGRDRRGCYENHQQHS